MISIVFELRLNSTTANFACRRSEDPQICHPPTSTTFRALSFTFISIILDMAPAANNPQSPAKSKKEKEREKRERAAQQQTERLKVVVRRLPPNLPEDIFWQTVQKWVTEETTTWKVFYPGKFKKRYNRSTWSTFVKLISNIGITRRIYPPEHMWPSRTI